MASWYTAFIAKCIFPLQEKLKKHTTLAVFKQLEQSQWQDAASLAQQQADKLHRFMAKVYQNVPYYRQLMQQHSLTPEHFKHPSDLSQLPFLTKPVISENFAALKANNATALKRFNTGGSSGQPLIFLLGNERVSYDVAQKWRATRWWGVDIGDKEIVAWGSPIELNAQDKVRIWRDKLFRSTLIPAFDMTEQKLLGFLNTIKKIKPKMLFGYPSVYHLLAKTAKQHNIDMSALGIKVIFVTSERLYPYQRELISEVFAAPVANGYGGRDAGFIAHECPHGSMHLSYEDIIVEIIDPNGQVLPNGQSGEIVVTHLATSEFPFIRYRTGDIGTLATKPCSCGRGLPVLEAIEGRSTDFVVASDGTMMHGLSLIYILREIPGVEAFRIEQQSLALTQVQVVWPQGALPDEVNSKIITGFKARLGQDVQIAIQQVDTIAAEKSGKFRYVISKVVA
ncbi:phenylacetate--CoA ligase family protein [Rheinheimera sp. MMS21-TC3]|uniref:phenylacetate--CoA ligase family protein n=1 Tax=Rheinheimera sp. MMS21-TC3 TaxID=3072790 RepID=UPI0028C5106F|nr:AMP-binding protein [Rheinheimera sp. MMS21-TC3]WNO60689.1 AMP-binding protein [Rheinheimera sp. MMS21-TC3]